MTTIALLGNDGSGKTTVANAILEAQPKPIRYLYMGTAIGSSNYALPTSRLMHYLKSRRKGGHSGNETELRQLKKRDNRSSIAAVFRLLHRLAEEWYRQIISWSWQARGYVVLYDRHFLFECAPSVNDSEQEKRRLGDRIHFWMLKNVFPKPDLMLFLDASPEILFQRKPETTLDYLVGRRASTLAVAEGLENFVRVDASQPLEVVVDTALTRIHELLGTSPQEAAD